MSTVCLAPSGARRSGRRLTATVPAAPLPPREVWMAYRREPTVQMRNLIIEAYLPLLKTISLSVHKRLPAQIDLDELVSAGIFGLMDAIEAFDPERNIQFSTFCSRRVRGSIIDELRQMDLPPRQVREHEALLKKVCDSFQKEFGRPPCDEEVLSRLGVGNKQARKILRNGRVTHVSSLSEPTGFRMDRPLKIEDTVPDRAGAAAFSGTMLRDLKDWTMRHLSRTERLVIVLYYAEGMTMREIGRALGLSESRVCQLRTVVLAKLQAQIRARNRDADE